MVVPYGTKGLERLDWAGVKLAAFHFCVTRRPLRTVGARGVPLCLHMPVPSWFRREEEEEAGDGEMKVEVEASSLRPFILPKEIKVNKIS